MEVLANTQDDVMREAGRFFKTCHPNSNGATLVTLSGNLGVGKTVFVKGVALYGGITNIITSPTFVFMKEYILPSTENSFKRLIHIDAYRMETPEMLHTIVPEDIFADPENIIFLEWPQQVKKTLPNVTHAISMETLPDMRRRIIYDYNQ